MKIYAYALICITCTASIHSAPATAQETPVAQQPKKRKKQFSYSEFLALALIHYIGQAVLEERVDDIKEVPFIGGEWLVLASSLLEAFIFSEIAALVQDFMTEDDKKRDKLLHFFAWVLVCYIPKPAGLSNWWSGTQTTPYSFPFPHSIAAGAVVFILLSKNAFGQAKSQFFRTKKHITPEPDSDIDDEDRLFDTP